MEKGRIGKGEGKMEVQGYNLLKIAQSYIHLNTIPACNTDGQKPIHVVAVCKHTIKTLTKDDYRKYTIQTVNTCLPK